MTYKIKIELFEGPLDLLLYLVKKDHLNIYDIPIAQITQQYMRYLELMQLLDLNIAGEFLVMAATLLQIKSKLLLPPEEKPKEEEEDAEDPRAELIRKLLEYEKFKQIAEELRQKETSQQEIFKRPARVENDVNIPTANETYFEASIFDLINAFSKALKDIPKDLFYEVIKDEFTIEEKVHQILHLLLVESNIRISILFTRVQSKVEIIVTFLAVLELIKMKEITARQTNLFEDIEISRNKENIIPYEKRDTPETDNQ